MRRWKLTGTIWGDGFPVEIMVEHLPSIVELRSGLAIVPCLHDDLQYHTPCLKSSLHSMRRRRRSRECSRGNPAAQRFECLTECEVHAHLIQRQILQRGSLDLVIQIRNVRLMMLTPVELQSLLCTPSNTQSDAGHQKPIAQAPHPSLSQEISRKITSPHH